MIGKTVSGHICNWQIYINYKVCLTTVTIPVQDTRLAKMASRGEGEEALQARISNQISKNGTVLLQSPHTVAPLTDSEW